MEKINNILEKKIKEAFEKAGYNTEYGKITVSDRPDLCEFQCNGAMLAAKEYKKAPYIIAEEVVNQVEDNVFECIEVVKPGFINIKVSPAFLTDYCNEMLKNNIHKYKSNGKKVIIDYGGPNIAKPLHVGHLRPAVIGESIKRIHKFMGDDIIGDIHLGDWGLQMGLIIEELKERKPNLPYFDKEYKGEYPKEAPFTIDELEDIYPAASAKTKTNEQSTEEEIKNASEFLENARINTGLLQQFDRGYYELWKKIVQVSLEDLKKNYKRLNVDFELWLGESDSQKYVPEMIEEMKKRNIIYESDGAMVVDVEEPEDKIKINPCMILKRGGVSCYQTTDLATLLQREKEYNPEEIIYVVDKRQELHFTQIFRCAKKAELVDKNTKLTFLGFGTINGKDGKPFKTRDGGVMRLENLIDEINEKVYSKMQKNNKVTEETRKIAEIVGLSALKYADLSNQISKDYIFDTEKFTSFEGNTGPYILYTIVRIKSIIKKYLNTHSTFMDANILLPKDEIEKRIMLCMADFYRIIEQAYEKNAPYIICNYIYELSNLFNTFYNKTKILEEEENNAKSYINLINLMQMILEKCIDLLGFSAPDRM